MATLERLSISMSPSGRALIESAAKSAGVSVSASMVHAAKEEARWAMAAEIASEIAAEVGVTPEDRAWAARVLGVDTDGRYRTPKRRAALPGSGHRRRVWGCARARHRPGRRTGADRTRDRDRRNDRAR